jgi:SAM-dependent methyltransferase
VEHPEPPERARAAFERVGASYAEAGPVHARYVRAKLRLDPIHRAALEILPREGVIVDLGCGAGQLALLLADGAHGRTLLGIDRDGERVARARAAAERARLEARVRFLVGDARTAPLPACDGALLVDLLHSMPPQHQDELLRRAAQALRPGGVLLVRDVDRGARPRWRYGLVLLAEALATAAGWSKGGEGLWFRRAEALAAVLTAEGLRIETRPMWGRTPYANVLVLGRKDVEPV